MSNTNILPAVVFGPVPGIGTVACRLTAARSMSFQAQTALPPADNTRIATPTATQGPKDLLSNRRKMHIEIDQRIYQVTSSATTLAGEQERIFTVSVLPVANGSTGDTLEMNTISITGTMRQVR